MSEVRATTLSVSGQITTVARGRLAPPAPTGTGALAGRITTGSWGLIQTRPLLELLVGGTITTASSGAVRTVLNRYLTGQITTQARGNVAQVGRLLAGRIKSATTLTATFSFQTAFAGRITTTSADTLAPTLGLSGGTITTTLTGRVENLPILPSAPPPVCVLDVTLDDYLDLVTSEHWGKPRFEATLSLNFQPYVDSQILTWGMPCLYDVDVAVGTQLDATGQWIGKTRYVDLGDVFFSWDTPGLGWEQANWRGPVDPPDALETLDDTHYRLLLYATITANHWNGSIPAAYASWDTLFAGTGFEVMIQDYGNMQMAMALRNTGTGGHIDAVTQALFQSGEMDLKPEGVTLRDYMFQASPGVPFYAWDAATDSAAGWDTGYWGVLVAPGQGYVPEYPPVGSITATDRPDISMIGNVILARLATTEQPDTSVVAGRTNVFGYLLTTDHPDTSAMAGHSP